MAAPPNDAAYGPAVGLLAPLPAAERGVAVVTSASADGRYLVYCNGTNVIVRDLQVRLGIVGSVRPPRGRMRLRFAAPRRP